MRFTVRFLLIIPVSILTLGAGPRRDDAPVVRVSDGEELARVCAAPLANLRIVLERDIDLVPTAAIDSTCGNCPDPSRRVPMTVGVTLSGRGVWLDGNRHEIRTHAGYGVYFKDCDDCGIENTTVTGGERDTAQAATDAGVVVRNGRVTIRNTTIRDNIGDPETVRRTVVGIMGVCGREGADVTVQNCEITRNSWDGVALYRDARAVIRSNYIDGVDRAHGGGVGGGRGVAIGVTWNARAVIERNWVRRYWKGIGAFVDADVAASGNIVEEMLTWGVSIWDAGTGVPRAVVERNVVYDCGACGIAVTMAGSYHEGAPPGRLTRNIVVHTGQNPSYDAPDAYCYQCALALHAVPDGFSVRGNTFHDNRTAADSLFSADASREMFWRGRRGWVRTFRNTAVGVDGRLHFHQSAFLTRYPRWWN